MRLEEISLEHEAAFLAMIEDYRKNDPATYAALYERAGGWSAPGFHAFVKECETERMDWRPKAGKVSVTRYVLLDDGGAVCGNGLMRFPLDARTEHEGGNLRVDVPPAKRGEKNGAVTLNRMLFEAVRAGMARVLVTCDADHKAAVRAIEMNRGERENTVVSKETGRDVARYWIRLR